MQQLVLILNQIDIQYTTAAERACTSKTVQNSHEQPTETDAMRLPLSTMKRSKHNSCKCQRAHQLHDTYLHDHGQPFCASQTSEVPQSYSNALQLWLALWCVSQSLVPPFQSETTTTNLRNLVIPLQYILNLAQLVDTCNICTRIPLSNNWGLHGNLKPITYTQASLCTSQQLACVPRSPCFIE